MHPRDSDAPQHDQNMIWDFMYPECPFCERQLCDCNDSLSLSTCFSTALNLKNETLAGEDKIHIILRKAIEQSAEGGLEMVLRAYRKFHYSLETLM